MKKIIAVLLALALCLSLSALAEEATPEAAVPQVGLGNLSGLGPMVGGWQATEDATVSEEMKSLVKEAFGGIGEEAIAPVAVLGTQVVAGQNICVLCRITPDAEETIPYYALVYIYKNLEGGAQLLQIRELNLGQMMDDDNG